MSIKNYSQNKLYSKIFFFFNIIINNRNIEEQMQQLTLGDETELERSLSDDEYLEERRRRSLRRSMEENHNIEAIYAVVDLKDKHARRAKLKEIEKKEERERPKSCNFISMGDYEEVSFDIMNKILFHVFII